MKEAAGEANMTVITIVLIGIVLLVGTLVVTTMMNNATDKASQDASSSESGQVCPNGYELDENNHCVSKSSGE